MKLSVSAMTVRLLGVGCVLWAGAAAAVVPEPWQMGMQPAVTPIAREIHGFHTLLMWLITIITIFVAGLLAYCMWKFNEKANPVPSKTSHNTAIEIAWTVVPVLILVLISIPSFRLLRNQLIIPPADIVIKATGQSWYWEYEYVSMKEPLKFDQRILSDPNDQSKALPGPDGTPKLFATDNDVVVPVNKVVHMQVTAGAASVTHAFTVPAFGIKIDAMPGRMNETWFKAEREGTYHGQCSELCGQFHAYMPITVKVVSEAAYEKWVEEAKKKFASSTEQPAGATRLADAR